MNELLELFLTLIKIDSETGQEKKISDFCVGYLKRIGYLPKQFANGNLFLQISCQAKQTLMLNAHLDTVAPGKNVKPIKKGPYIMASGKTILGADNKAALAVILYLLKQQARRKFDLKYNLEVFFIVSEESDNLGAKSLDYKKIQSKYVLMADSILPIGCLVQGAPFYVRFDGLVVGRDSHACQPENGNNSLLPFNYFLKEINLGKNENRTLNIGKMMAGTARNTVPGQLSFEGEIRAFKKLFIEKEIKKLKRIAQKIQKIYSLEKFELEFVYENSGYLISKADGMLKKVEAVIKKQKLNYCLRENWACSDANIFAEKGLIPINLGDGVLDAHSKEEKIKVKDLEKLYQLFQEILTSQ